MFIEQKWLDKRSHLYLNSNKTEYNVARISFIYYLNAYPCLYIPFKINNRLVNLK